jgi:cyclic pyranopterin phosphate synthase
MPYIDLTTNISLLNEENIKMLNKYSVNALTLSLDTLDCKKFEYLSNFKNFELIRKNLDYTLNNFSGKIRANCIVFDEMFDQNDYEQVLNMCKEKNIGLRFVEPSIVEGLKITYGKEKFHYLVDLLRTKADRVIKSDCESVEYFFFDNWYLTIMHSLCDNKLCSSCKNYMYIRVSSEYKLKPCLSRTDTEVDIDFSSDETMKRSYVKAIKKMGVGLKNE